MRNFASIVCLITLLCCTLPMLAQHRQITQAEYFWDTDPGQGNGTIMLAVDGNFNTALEGVFQDITNLPAPGLHTIGVRVKAANNSWGATFMQVVEIVPATANVSLPFEITTGELYWDADPGFGNGIALLAFNGNFDEALEQAIGSATAPSDGQHLLSIRLKDGYHNWGPSFSSVVDVSLAGSALSGTLQVTAAECFWGTDPGFGNGTALLAFNGNFDEALEQAIGSATAPSAGQHLLSIRLKDGYNNWGPSFSAVVDVSPAGNVLPGTLQVTAAEYFWGTDPGFGSGTALLAFNGNFDEALEQAIGSATAPSAGQHLLSIRLKDGYNNWGPSYSAVVDVSSPGNAFSGTLQVTAAECFWGTDPGFGNGTVLLALNGNFDDAIESAVGNIAVPSSGIHNFSIRLKGTDNQWGPVFTAVVQVINSNVTILSSLQITAAELFWDIDPGQGNGVTMLAIGGNFDQALETALKVAPVPAAIGFHNLYIRVRDNQNNWGQTFNTVVEVQANSSGAILPSIEVAAAEYFFDNDPGQGEATKMLAFDGNFNTAIEKIAGGNIPAPVVMGYHTLYMRVQDGANKWGPVFGTVVYIDTTIAFVSQINGPTQLCSSAPSNVAYSAPAIFGNTYSWSITGGNIVSGLGTRNIKVDWNAIGPYQLSLLECNNGASLCDSASIIVTLKPNAASSISQTICQGQSYLGYTAPGTYRDTFLADNGCDSVRTLLLTVKPNAASSISQTVCQGQSYLGYTVTGTYRDTFLAANGCDSVRTLLLTVKPNATSSISQTICQGQSYLGYTTAGTYRDTILTANGCDSVRTLLLTVKPAVRTSINISVCYGQQYHGYTVGGTYVDTFTAASGCDSIRTLNFVVRQPYNAIVNRTVCFGDNYLGYTATGTYIDSFVHVTGCDSVRTLFLTVLPLIKDTINVTICQGRSYAGYTFSGTYVDTFNAISGCDSIRVLHLNVTPAITSTVSKTICQGSSYAGYSASGNYTDIFVTSAGCDSIRQLQLTVLPHASSTVTATICFGDVFEGHSATGVFRHTYVAANGCDSIRNVNLIVRPMIATVINQTICNGQSYLGFNTSGTFIDTFVATSGCDSIRTLNLTVVANPQTFITQTICFGQFYSGYNQSGTYVDTFTARNGCDSVRTLTLTVLPQITYTYDVIACQGDVVDGYSTAGVYIDTLTAANGCDSIRTLQLTMLQSQTVLNKIYICNGDSIKLGNTWYYTDGMYTDTIVNANGCFDYNITQVGVKFAPAKPLITASNNTLSVPAVFVSYQWLLDGSELVGETANQIVANDEGSYSVKVSDESTCLVVSDAYEYLPVGVAELANSWAIAAYPNPTNGIVYLMLRSADEVEVNLYNGLGQLIYQNTVTANNEVAVDLSGHAVGVYYIKASVGKEIINQKIVKTH